MKAEELQAIRSRAVDVIAGGKKILAQVTADVTDPRWVDAANDASASVQDNELIVRLIDEVERLQHLLTRADATMRAAGIEMELIVFQFRNVFYSPPAALASPSTAPAAGET